MGFETVFLNVALLIALSVPGFILRKTKRFGRDAVKVLVSLLIFAAQPAMVAKSFLTLKFSRELGLNILFVTVAFIAVMLIAFFISIAVFREKKAADAVTGGNAPDTDQKGIGAVLSESTAVAPEGAEWRSGAPETQTGPDAPAAEGFLKKIEIPKNTANVRTYRFASMFGNTGYLALPLISVLFPGNDVMLLYTSICIVAFNLLTWTLGVFIMTGDRKSMSLKKCLLTPVPLTAALTVPFFFIPAFITPEPVIKFFDSFGLMTTPLSMIIMGARIAEMPFREIFTDLKIYAVAAIRLLAAPAAAFGILKLFGVTDTDLFNALIAVCMMPTAAATIVFAEKFLPDSYTAIKSVLLTSILCILTIPVISMLVFI